MPNPELNVIQQELLGDFRSQPSPEAKASWLIDLALKATGVEDDPSSKNIRFSAATHLDQLYHDNLITTDEYNDISEALTKLQDQLN